MFFTANEVSALRHWCGGILTAFARVALVGAIIWKKDVKGIAELIDEVLVSQVQEILAPIKDCGWILGRLESN
jgi:hypothetical protein